MEVITGIDQAEID